MKTKLVLIFFSIIIIGVLLVAGGNYFLNPLTYSNASLREAGAVLSSGKGIAFPEPTLDFRGLRRAHIEQMTETPDIVIFSGSRWQEATSDLAPGQKLYNSFVSSDHMGDMMAIAQLLDENGRLPKTLILSVRYTTFNFIEERTKTNWKSFSPEYRAMAARLDVETPPWHKTAHLDKWFNLLSVDALIDRLDNYAEVPVTWEVADDQSGELLDVIAADGGIRFSQRHLKKFTPEYVEKDSIEKATVDAKKRISIDPESPEQLKELLKFLQERDVRVVFAQTPFHHEYYKRIQGTPYLEDMTKVDATMNEIASEYGITVVGGFDPVANGCDPKDFIDYHHATYACISKIYNSIPGLRPTS